MSATLHQACLLLGSNIEPEINIPRAVDLLQEKVTILKLSSIWESASAYCCYPDFLNMAALVSTRLSAAEFKRQILRPLEAQMGRVRTEDKNASRTIDIDIILFDKKVMDPDLWMYVHRAAPVAELFPDIVSESGERLKDIAQRLAALTPIQARPDISIALQDHTA
jgi:2-amino-4-hydroxy-6-hydroxymethyldihydropteridine diphosphokinase